MSNSAKTPTTLRCFEIGVADGISVRSAFTTDSPAVGGASWRPGDNRQSSVLVPNSIYRHSRDLHQGRAPAYKSRALHSTRGIRHNDSCPQHIAVLRARGDEGQPDAGGSLEPDRRAQEGDADADRACLAVGAEALDRPHTGNDQALKKGKQLAACQAFFALLGICHPGVIPAGFCFALSTPGVPADPMVHRGAGLVSPHS